MRLSLLSMAVLPEGRSSGIANAAVVDGVLALWWSGIVMRTKVALAGLIMIETGVCTFASGVIQSTCHGFALL